jgi:membrane protease YdiL (CAAX protease family)
MTQHPDITDTLSVSEMPGTQKLLRWLEFSFLYLALPLLFAFKHTSSPIYYLLLLSVVVFVILYRSNGFHNEIFINKSLIIQELPRILAIFAVIMVVLLIFTRLLYPESLFFCIKNHFSVWCSLMIVYPLLSVYPQELIYRAFLFHRYGRLCNSESSVVHLSALAFSFGHIIYFHPVSLLLTFFGGYLFAWTYRKTRSLLAVSIEHALYGCLLYTIGLGRFFYTGFDKLFH